MFHSLSEVRNGLALLSVLLLFLFTLPLDAAQLQLGQNTYTYADGQILAHFQSAQNSSFVDSL